MLEGRRIPCPLVHPLAQDKGRSLVRGVDPLLLIFFPFLTQPLLSFFYTYAPPPSVKFCRFTIVSSIPGVDARKSLPRAPRFSRDNRKIDLLDDWLTPNLVSPTP